MAERFYLPELNEAASLVTLIGPEHHHLRTVCRAKPGTRLELFDGRGLTAQAWVETIERRETVLVVEQIARPWQALSPLHLACCLPKGDRADFLIEKCTELGVTRFWPLRSERGVVDPKEGKLEKLRRVVVEACKQCGRNELMPVEEPLTLAALLHELAQQERYQTAARWFLHAHPPKEDEGPEKPIRASHVRDSIIRAASVRNGSQPIEAPVEQVVSPLLAAVGPEGGWTPAEVAQAAEAGWRLVHFPGAVLRIETAAVVLASLARVEGLSF